MKLHKPVALLALAAFPLLFANGRNTIAVAAWLAPVFLLRYVRTVRVRIAFPAVFALLFGMWLFQFRGMVPAPAPIVIGVALSYAFLGLGPYALDRLLVRTNASGALSTLLFPCAAAALEFIFLSLSPYGSWGSVAYSQYGNLPLMQLASVTGLYGITFLVMWLASTLNRAWESGPRWSALWFVAVTTVVLIAGGARFTFFAPGATRVRIAGITPEHFKSFPNDAAENRFWSKQPVSDSDLNFTRAAFARAADDLLTKSDREARAGARLVFWSEGAAPVLRADEPALLAKGAGLARRDGIWLGMAMTSFAREQRKPMRNKFALIGPDGRVLYEYWKSRPVPGGEAQLSETNGNAMRYADTALGRAATFICFDLDFPRLVRQAGAAQADLLLAPSNDWRAIDPWHTQMAGFRAVENGVNLFRDTGHGLSMAVDYQGRVLAQADYFNAPDHRSVAYLPTRGVPTIYSQVGDLFGWLATAGLAGLAFLLRR